MNHQRQQTAGKRRVITETDPFLLKKVVNALHSIAFGTKTKDRWVLSPSSLEVNTETPKNTKLQAKTSDEKQFLRFKTA